MRKLISGLLAVLFVCMLICPSTFAEAKADRTKELLKNSSDYLNASGKKMNSLRTPAVYADKSAKEILTFWLGDVTGDGIVNTGDAVMILKFGVDMLELDNVQLIVGDANQNGKVNPADATHVLRICVGLIEPQQIEIDNSMLYSVTYNDGIDGLNVEVPSDDACKEGDFYYLAHYAPSCAGRSFMGWRSSFDNVLYVYGDSFIMPSQDVVLTAEWQEDIGHILTVQAYDVFNEEIVYTFEVTISETTTYNQSNFPFPDGYKMYGAQSFTINYTQSGISPSAITVNCYLFIMTEGVERTIIYTPQGVNNIRMDLDRDYILKGDIDMAEMGKFDPIGWATEADVEDAIFTGSIDGNDCGILNLNCDFWDTETYMCTNVGFISRNAGTIKNLTVITALPSETSEDYGVFGYYNVGIIAGRNESGGKIEYCFAQGNFGTSDTDETARGAAGGIVGSNQGTIRCCGANAAGEGFFYLGGVAGKNFGTMDQCWSAGAINHGMDDETLEYYEIWCIGGIVGGASGTLTNSYAILIGEIAGYMVVGGIIGWVEGGTVRCCYVAFAENIYATLTEYSGGAFGYVKVTPTNQYLYGIDSTTAIPTGFSATIWDMNGLCFTDLPDLISFRRPPEATEGE